MSPCCPGGTGGHTGALGHLERAVGSSLIVWAHFLSASLCTRIEGQGAVELEGRQPGPRLGDQAFIGTHCGDKGTSRGRGRACSLQLRIASTAAVYVDLASPSREGETGKALGQLEAGRNSRRVEPIPDGRAVAGLRQALVRRR